MTIQLNKIRGKHIRRKRTGERYLYPKEYIWNIPPDLRGKIEIGDVVEVIGSQDWVKVMDVFHEEDLKNNQFIYRLIRKSDPLADFSYQLKELRKKQNMTQQQLAKVLGVSQRTISLWEKQVSKPQKRLYPKIREMLDIKIRF